RRARWNAVALPIPPRPMTMASYRSSTLMPVASVGRPLGADGVPKEHEAPVAEGACLEEPQADRRPSLECGHPVTHDAGTHQQVQLVHQPVDQEVVPEDVATEDEDVAAASLAECPD